MLASGPHGHPDEAHNGEEGHGHTLCHHREAQPGPQLSARSTHEKHITFGYKHTAKVEASRGHSYRIATHTHILGQQHAGPTLYTVCCEAKRVFKSLTAVTSSHLICIMWTRNQCKNPCKWVFGRVWYLLYLGT